MTPRSFPRTSPPLPPPNRRVKRVSRPVIEAPDERISLEGAGFDEERFDSHAHRSPPEAASNGQSMRARAPIRWREGARAAAGVLVTMAAALGCVWGLLRYTRTSPRFAIRTIHVQGGARRSPEDLARLSRVFQGQNIFTTDLEAAHAALLEDPWIEQATIRRKLPDTVALEVVEREAAALVSIGPDLYLSTRQGELFKKPEPGDPFDLPVITGTKADDIVQDRAAAVAMVKRGLDLLAEYEHTSLGKQLPVQEVHLEDDGGFVLMVGKDPIALHLGKGPYRQSLEQATRVMSELATQRAQASIVFLDNEAHPERVVVRMR